MTDLAPSKEPVVICGAGIVGCSTAYYLARRGTSSILIERHAVAGCASGRAGGFLAKGWGTDGSWEEFARVSFEIHMQLADRFQDCDYRRIDAVRIVVGNDDDLKTGDSAVADNGRSEASKECEEEVCDLSLVPPWVDGQVIHASRSGDPCNSAQVHPRKLCHALLDAAKALVEVRVVDGQVTGFVRSGRRVTGVCVTSSSKEQLTVSGAAVVIAMGPWSGQACQWLGLPPLVGGCRGHSVIARVPESLRPHLTATALFTELIESEDQEVFIEIYPRPDDTIYMCGLMDYQRLPSNVSGVHASPSSIKILKEKSSLICSRLQDCEVLSESACFMPKTEDDLFLIGQLPGAPGVFIGSGHNYWGILAGPASGRALAELIIDGQCSFTDISPFDPRRFFATKPKGPPSPRPS